VGNGDIGEDTGAPGKTSEEAEEEQGGDGDDDDDKDDGMWK
jgi:hypothetical protein